MKEERMLAVLSPAKALDLTPPPLEVDASQPPLMEHVETLMQTTRGLSQKKIRELMKLSEDLGKLNFDRYQAFSLPLTEKNAHTSMFAFNGEVYRGLDARTLNQKDLNWAQEHVAILSGLYGILRPKDLMQAYRLEMGTRLSTRRGANLYAFWGEHITNYLNAALESHDDSTLVNLASNEYFKAVKPKELNGNLVTCVFEDWKEHKDEGKVISFMAKNARGLMARYIIQSRIERVSDLKDFAVARYVFRPDRSSEDKYVFSRPFIPVAVKKAQHKSMSVAAKKNTAKKNTAKKNTAKKNTAKKNTAKKNTAK